MPYSGADDPDLPSNVKKMSDKDRRQWVDVFNSAYASCMKDKNDADACETSAFKQANGVLKKEKSILSTFMDQLKGLFRKEHAISMPDLYDQVYSLTMNSGESSAWLIDVYASDSGMFAIFVDQGKLYKASLVYSEQYNAVSMQGREFWQEVMEEYVPVSRQIKIRADGDKMRWFLIAGTTIINRNGEIDSSNLFDSMIAKCESSGNYPYLTFFHLGKDLQMGDCDYLAREGVALIASGLFNDSKQAKAMIRSYNENPTYWGSSIGFYAELPEMVNITQDVKLPVYTDGEFIEISILPEKQACAIMTALRSTKENIMNERVKKAITDLAGGDESLAEEFINMVDDVNRATEEQGLIHRDVPDTGTTVEDSTEDIVEQAVEDSVQDEIVVKELEIDEEVIHSIADATLSSPAIQDFVQSIQQKMDEVSELVNAQASEIKDLHAALIRTNQKLEAKVEELAKDEEIKKQEWENDLSSQMINKIRVTHRPTRVADAESVSESLADIANSTVANIK